MAGQDLGFRTNFTPTSASWLDLVELLFGIIERLALTRSDVASVIEVYKKTWSSSPAVMTAATRSSGPRPAPRSQKVANRATTSMTAH